MQGGSMLVGTRLCPWNIFIDRTSDEAFLNINKLVIGY